MLNIVRKLIYLPVSILFLSVLIISNITAQTIDNSIAEKILAKLKSARSDIPYQQVETTEIPGLYKVTIKGGETIYSSSTGDYFIAGEMYQVTTGKFVSLHQQDKDKQRITALNELNPSDLIVYEATKAHKSTIYIFTDVDCNYCAKLHLEIPALNAMGVEVRYVAFPVAGIYSPSFTKIATAWCALEPKKVLPLLQRGDEMPLNDCDNNPVMQHFVLGKQIGVTATPTIILPNGKLLPGYKSAEQLAELLAI